MTDKSPLHVSLTGPWTFAYTLAPLADEPRTLADLERVGLELRPCHVPGNLELDLQAQGLLPDPFHGMNMTLLRPLEHAHVWYGRSFEVGDQPAGAHAELIFEGLDCLAEVYLNGQHIGSCENMLVEQVLPAEGLLSGENELLVHIRPAYEEARRYDYATSQHSIACCRESLYIRKAPHMYGWDIMPRALSAGIWRPVSLRFRPDECLDEVYLDTLEIAPDRSSARLSLYYRARLDARPEDVYEIEIEGNCGASVLRERRRMLFEVGSYAFSVDKPALWWPRGRGEPNLYQCTATVFKNGARVDRRAFTLGVRTVQLQRTSVTDQFGNGEFCFRVNGERVFIMGSNWVPVDAFHSRDVARTPAIIALALECGVNMFRCWGGNVYESDLFYDLCDRHGILVWQDFAMACAVYPQDAQFASRLESEARAVVRRLRQHPSIALWAGDNECDQAYSWGGRQRDPNTNVLTREVLPRVMRDEDPSRPYLPSSPYVDPAAFKAGIPYLPENHLWGPRDYFKSDYYKRSLCHFASEIGYHGCPSPASIRRFISPVKLWPYQNNDEWLLHATSPVPGVNLFDYRVELMAKQVRELFGQVPDTLEDYALASQISQAEAKKFFIELFRTSKWRRTGLIWWNLIDGWPQFSDAVVDYYYSKKLAYDYIQRSQAPLCLTFKEPETWALTLVACNDTREDVRLAYTVRDVERDAVVSEGSALACADAVTKLTQLPYSQGEKRFYLITWHSLLGEGRTAESRSVEGRNHYLAGNPPFDLVQYRCWLEKAGLLTHEWLSERGFTS